MSYDCLKIKIYFVMLTKFENVSNYFVSLNYVTRG
jgi:hypothetical protein